MLKKTITYEDFNEEQVSEDFFFHLSKAELVELELSHEGGLSESLQRIIDAEDGRGIVAEFKNIILTAYGKRSTDGKRFIKNQQIREEFESTEAYSALFMELITDTDAAIEFINGVIPQGMAEEAAKIASADLQLVEEEKVVVISGDDLEPQKEQPGPRIITKKDLIEMPMSELAGLQAQLESGEAKLEQ